MALALVMHISDNTINSQQRKQPPSLAVKWQVMGVILDNFLLKSLQLLNEN